MSLNSLMRGESANDVDLDKYEVNTLHSIISSLRNNLSIRNEEIKAVTVANKDLKRSIDMLSAELGKAKRKLKRKENKS